MEGYKLVEEITVDEGVALLNKLLAEYPADKVEDTQEVEQYSLQIFEHVRSIAPIVTIKFNCGKEARNLGFWLKKSFTCCNVLAPDMRQIMASHGSVSLWDEKEETLKFEENRINFEALPVEQQRSITL